MEIGYQHAVDDGSLGDPDRARRGVRANCFYAAADTGFGLSDDHIDYCFSRYRSYRPEDNSYQPYGGGPRQQCREPAGRSRLPRAGRLNTRLAVRTTPPRRVRPPMPARPPRPAAWQTA